MNARALFRTATVAALACGLTGSAAEAQSSGRFAAGASLESYSFGEPTQAGVESITLLTAPFGARVPLGTRASIDVTGAYAMGKLTAPDGSEFELNGITDTQVLVNVDVVPDALTLTAIVSAPTGQATHDTEQSVVAGAIAADLLPFRITNWGSGGGVGMQLTGTRRFEGFGAGLSVAYRQAREFEPLDASTVKYQPGNELRVRLALDTELGRNAKGSLVVGFQQYAEDQVDDSNLFQSGNRIEVLTTYAFPLGYRASAALYGGLLHRANGQFLGAAAVADAPSQDLILAGGILRRAVGRNWVTPRVDFRAFRSEDGLGQGYVGSVGLGFEVRSGTTTFIPAVTGRFGSVEAADGQESGITGFEAGVTLRFGR